MTNWTEEQQAIFAKARTGESFAVNAKAGSGKTTTSAEAMGLVKGRRKFASSFSKRTTTDLEQAMPTGVVCKTQSSVGYAALRDSGMSRGRPDFQKQRSIVKALGLPWKVETLVNKSLGQMRSKMIKPQMDHWGHVLEDVMIDNGANASDVASYADAVKEGFIQCTIALENGTVDFADMLWGPWAYNLPIPINDVSLIDEAQDLNPLQHWITRKGLSKRGQLIVVGDPFQAIYGFTGALDSSFAELSKGLESLSLSTCWRCDSDIIAYAQTIVPEIYARPDAPAGIVDLEENKPWTLNPDIQEALLCRTNAPLARCAASFLQKQIPFIFLGRDYLGAVKSLIERIAGKSLSSDSEKARGIHLLRVYEERERERLEKAKKLYMMASIEDRVEGAIALLEAPGCVFALISQMQQRANDADADSTKVGVPVLSTIHQAKGREWHTVTEIEPSVRRKIARKAAEGKPHQEFNLHYVMITRAERVYRSRSLAALEL